VLPVAVGIAAMMTLSRSRVYERMTAAEARMLSTKNRGGRVSETRRSGVLLNVSAQQAVFAEFYAQNRDDCLRAVFASTGDRLAAEDSVAEAFARAWASWRKVSTHPVPRAWVIRTALNLSVSSWRRRRREVPIGQLTVPSAGPADSMTGQEPDSPVLAALATLPLRQRQVVALRVFLDLDTATTAQVLGIAPGTVTAHLARATAALREQLIHAGREE
jgi:RNA polymerase sigma factor (sigma-70 family)